MNLRPLNKFVAGRQFQEGGHSYAQGAHEEGGLDDNSGLSVQYIPVTEDSPLPLAGFEFYCLPFGITSALGVFTNLMKFP